MNKNGIGLMLAAAAMLGLDGEYTGPRKPEMPESYHRGMARAKQLAVSRRGVMLYRNCDAQPLRDGQPEHTLTSFQRDTFCVRVRKLRAAV